jgi:hypothetical protein
VYRSNAAVSVAQLPLPVTLNNGAAAVGTATMTLAEPFVTLLGSGQIRGSQGPGAGGAGGGGGGGTGDGGRGWGSPPSFTYKSQPCPLHCTVRSDFLSHPFELNAAQSVSLRHWAVSSAIVHLKSKRKEGEKKGKRKGRDQLCNLALEK